MPFLVGKNEAVSNVGAGTENLQNMLVQLLGSGGNLERLFPKAGVDPAVMQPYKDMFTMQNDRNFAQAKESAGNLTGSSLGHILGQEMGRASTEQGAFLANQAEGMRQNDTNRFVNLLLGALGSPAAGVQQMHTPGLLDYASQGAVGLASGGAFNGLFGKTKKLPGEG